MAFSVADFDDLVKLLTEHPEWRAQLRPLVLGEEMLSLPSRMDRVEAALAELSEEVRNLAKSVGERFNRVDGELGNIRGQMLEFAFEKNLSNWLRDWVRKPRKVVTDDLEKLDEAIESGRLSDAEVVQVAWVDALVRAKDKDTSEEVVLAVEISQTINTDDVERAASRASILRRADYDGRPFVAGNRITDQARALAEGTGTAVVLLRQPP
jgi:hypothetical protein